MNLSLKNIKTIIKKMDYEELTQDTLLDSRYENRFKLYGQYWPYYRLFYRLSQVLNPKLVVELGGYQGTAAAHFASANEETAVITIDHHTDDGDADNQVKMFEVVNKYKNLWYIQGWTTKKLADEQKGKHHYGDVQSAYPKVIDIMDEIGAKIDILFIDSWHHYDKAMNDWSVYSPLLASPALVICDDIQEDSAGMLDFWNDLPGDGFLARNIHPGTNMGFLIYE